MRDGFVAPATCDPTLHRFPRRRERYLERAQIMRRRAFDLSAASRL
ncbi:MULTISPECIES: hypothetical protein [Bradyrhizobium]|nr:MULTISPECIES: hypothetical protein [Bradyrhizobium]